MSYLLTLNVTMGPIVIKCSGALDITLIIIIIRDEQLSLMKLLMYLFCPSRQMLETVLNGGSRNHFLFHLAEVLSYCTIS